jgi:hypothetical protein
MWVRASTFVGEMGFIKYLYLHFKKPRCAALKVGDFVYFNKK